jgi:predicted dehydrogenase
LHTELNGQSFDKIYPRFKGIILIFDGMYHAIVNGSEAPVTAQEGVQVMEVITAAIQSSAEKKDRFVTKSVYMK